MAKRIPVKTKSKERPANAVGVSGSFTYVSVVSPTQKMFCGKSGISKKFGELTDQDIEKMIAKGNTCFSKI